MESITGAPLREVIVRFEGLPADSDPDEWQVHGTVVAAGEEQQIRPFTGWVQLLNHLEVLSACAAAGQDEPATPQETR